MYRFSMSAGVLVSALGLGAAAFAQSGPIVTMTSPDGKTTVTGELVEIVGDTYKIKTTLGVFDVDAATMACAGEGCPKREIFGERFAIAGSSAIGAELLPALVLGYADSQQATLAYEAGAGEGERTLRLVHENGQEMAQIDLSTLGSLSAFSGLATNAAAIGMSSRKITQAEAETLVLAGIPDPRETAAERVVALEATAIVVHPDNPLSSISLADLTAVYTGQITSWAALGGPDMPIKLYADSEESGAFQLFKQQILDPAGQLLPAVAQRFESGADLADSVSTDPYAIGFTSLAFTRSAKTLSLRQECGILTEPSLFSVKAEQYPLQRRLYLYERPEGMPYYARGLLDYAMSDEAQPVIAAAHLVDRSPEYRPLTDMGSQLVNSLTGEYEFSLDLFRTLVGELGDGRRLSTTFRFNPGSTQLDYLSGQAAAAVARQLASGAFKGQDMVLVGFSDAIGEFDQNLALSVGRAQTVYEAMIGAVGVEALSGVSLQVQGYGELMPVACNTTPPGRDANRRVEIWVRPARG
jgi:phosphate transport system substrate-binding protein